MQNLETNLTEDAPVNKEVVDENTAGNGGSRVASPADSPVYRASDDEVHFYEYLILLIIVISKKTKHY